MNPTTQCPSSVCLLHSDQYNIAGLVAATTSTWLNSTVVPQEILNTTHAFSLVQANLAIHTSSQFPTSSYLSLIVTRSHPFYKHPHNRPLPPLLQHLPPHHHRRRPPLLRTPLHPSLGRHLRPRRSPLPHPQHPHPSSASRTSSPTSASTPSPTKTPPLPGSAQNFPSIPYIVSLHGFNAYGLATWSGVSGEEYYDFDTGGPDSSLGTQSHIAQNFQLGPLGSHYPDIAYIMEGDYPAILHTMMNGLNGGPYDHPESGGWAARYILHDRSRQSNVYSNTYDDVVLGKDNRTLTSNHATIWRWRQAFQDEMSARVQCQPIIYTLPGGSTITLDVRKTYDPDETLPGKNELQYNWFQYREVTDVYINNIAFLPQLNFTTSESGRVVQTKLPEREVACSVPTGGQATYGVGEVCQNICYFGGGGEWEAAGEEV
ncbi:unnamed protein product [Zymoseptoria tritici ST99CH_3D7]|uniref:Uncharacterized protein n=1 Tax=Zymoseptoria tritici (strain ST99CH_3D7) TaxID=1276538 RepID=A0A1X7S1V4_ZYMT9|nr:unnamed protein product [Zymoseptoria tritici ST99CH_3D7]